MADVHVRAKSTHTKTSIHQNRKKVSQNTIPLYRLELAESSVFDRSPGQKGPRVRHKNTRTGRRK